jgi:hypothetical protein
VWLQEVSELANQFFNFNLIISNNFNNGTRSHKNISLDEVFLISIAAELSQYLDRKLEWLQSAFSLAQNEKKKKIIEKKIKDSKIKHDKGPNIYYVSTFQAFLTLPFL